MRYVINQKVVTSDRDPELVHCLREMAESSSDSSSSRSSCSSVTDDESIGSSLDSYSSGMSDDDGFPSLLRGVEVLLYQFEPEPSPEPSTEDPHARISTDDAQPNRQRKLVRLTKMLGTNTGCTGRVTQVVCVGTNFTLSTAWV